MQGVDLLLYWPPWKSILGRKKYQTFYPGFLG